MDPEGYQPTAEEMGIEPEATLTPEVLKNLQTLEIEAQGEFPETLEALNTTLGTSMQARPEGYHLTIISTPESGKLATLSVEQIARLQEINEAVQKGDGITVTGVGYIDGATAPNIRATDRSKKTSYLAVDIPALKGFREELGLPEKDFHITLGFEAGDIHMQVVGQNEKGKDVLGPMPKKPNPDLGRFVPQEVKFGSISGQPKQQPAKAV